MTPLKSTLPTGSEHVVGLRNASILTHQNCGLNAQRLPVFNHRATFYYLLFHEQMAM